MERRTFLAVAASGIAAGAAADSALNGRWDLTVPGDTRKRAWWIEIKDAGTGKPSGGFIGAPGGGLDQITDMKIENGVARWTFYRPARGENKEWRGIYEARVVGDKLQGSMKVEGRNESAEFFGVRAPKFPRVDPASLKAGKPIELFNGRDLSGWKPVRANVPMKWTVENGVLKNAPGTTDIVSEQKFLNFKLHAEYRYGEHSNSGIGLRARYEMQIFDDHGQAAFNKGHGSIYSRIAPSTNASKKPGEWQTADITLVGNRVTIVLNGTKVINDAEIEGLTAIAVDPHEAEPGPFVIQGDHGAVEFRKFTVTPLQS